VVSCFALIAALSDSASANTLCVKPGSSTCFQTISSAVNAASRNDVIDVAPGTYKEYVTIGKPLSLIGADGDGSIIDATGLAHGIFVDGYDNPGLDDVTIAGFKVENALFEGILVVSASNVTIRDNKIVDNDKSSGLEFMMGVAAGCPDQPGNGIYENDETGDCGGALHLIGAVNGLVSGNYVAGNADGILISDETAESRNNLIIHNKFVNNPLECGIVLASHPPMGTFRPHLLPTTGLTRTPWPTTSPPATACK
jgi:nitrous oxidase accessory protein NosD